MIIKINKFKINKSNVKNNFFFRYLTRNFSSESISKIQKEKQKEKIF